MDHADYTQYWVVRSTSLAAALAFTTAYLHPSPVVSNLAIASGVFSSMQIPATILLGIPKVFGPLLAMDRNDSMKDAKIGSPEAKQVDDLLRMWEQKHLLRFAVTGPALATALVALMLDGRV